MQLMRVQRKLSESSLVMCFALDLKLVSLGNFPDGEHLLNVHRCLNYNVNK